MIMNAHHCTIFVILLISFNTVILLVECDKIYIKPSGQFCSVETLGKQCLTLQQYAHGDFNVNSSINTYNQTLVLAQGTHYLWTNLSVSNNTAFEMYGENDEEVTVYCNYTDSNKGFQSNRIYYINIRGIIFKNCIKIYFQFVDTLILANNGLRILPLDVTWPDPQNVSPSWNLSGVLNVTILRMSVCHLSTLVEQSSLTIKQSKFNGAIHVVHTNIKITESNYTNTYDINYGVLRVKNGSITIHDSFFHSSTVLRSGAALYLTGINNYVYILNSMFMDNEAVEHTGGALYISGNNLSVSISKSF